MAHKMSTNELLDKAASELVEEILEATKVGGEKWFFVIRRKLQSLLRELKAKHK